LAEPPVDTLFGKVERSKLLAELNKAPTAAAIAKLGVSLQLAQQILEVRTKLRRGFQSLHELAQLVGGPQLTRWYLEEVAPACLDDRPALLLPIRIETRVVQGVLHIRFYPDDVHLDAHDGRLAPEEVAAGRAYLAAAGRDPASGSEAARDAWRALSARFGPRRAAWIRKAISDNHDGDPKTSRPSGWTEPPRVRVLPDRFVVYLYNAAGAPAHAPIAGALVPAELGVMGGLSADEPFAGDSAWVESLPAAIAAGMAVSVPVAELALDGKDRLSRIVVAGLRRQAPAVAQQALEGLIDAHHFGGGLAFVPQGTPTNNIEDGGAGFSASEDHEAAYGIEVQDPPSWAQASASNGHNAERLGRALGLGATPEALRHIEQAGDRAESYAGQMNAALWPATGGYFLRYMLEGALTPAEIAAVGEHFQRFVRAAGPLPALRIGRQPYGVLPATRRARAENGAPGWLPSEADLPSNPVFDGKLHGALTALARRWEPRALDPACTPRVGASQDPEQELLQVLSMQPVSASVTTRPFVDDRLVNWMLMTLRERAFGPGTVYDAATPGHWVRAWGAEARRERQRGQAMLADVAELAPEKLTDLPVTHVFGWWNTSSWLLLAGTPAEARQYLDALCRGDRSAEPVALLHELLLRSLALAGLWGQADLAAVQQAICRLASPWVERPHDILLPFHPAPELDVDPLFRQSLDLCSHRLDAWFTSLASKRLDSMRATNPDGIHLGAYGYVEHLDLSPAGRPSKGYIHTPSAGQTAAAAVLYNADLTHAPAAVGGERPFRINLTSTRVRDGLLLVDGVREGQPMGALLGYQFERALVEGGASLARYLDDFRAAFPITAGKLVATGEGEATHDVAARNVVDGAALVRAWRARQQADTDPDVADAKARLEALLQGMGGDEAAAIRAQLARLADGLDAVGDLLMYEGVFQAVQGNYEAAGAALDAAAGNGAPPALTAIRTRVAASTLEHRVAILFPADEGALPAGRALADARDEAEPRLSRWFQSVVGQPPGRIGCSYSYVRPDTGEIVGPRAVTLEEVGVSPLDFLYLAAAPLAGQETELERRIHRLARKREGLPHDQRIQLDLAAPEGAAVGLGEAAELARATLDLVAGAAPLGPADLTAPAGAADAYFAEPDLEELHERATRARRRLRALGDKLGELLPVGVDDPAVAAGVVLTDAQRTAIDEQLLDISRYGVPGAVAPGPDDPDLLSRAVNVRAEVDRRVAAAGRRVPKLVTGLTGAALDAAVQLRSDALKAIFGAAFVVLPRCAPAAARDLAASLAGMEGLGAPGAGRLRTWLEQVGQVHKPLEDLEAWLMRVEAWQGGGGSGDAGARWDLQVGQLPLVPGEHWLGLDDDERAGQARPREALSLVLLGAGALRGPAAGASPAAAIAVAGLVVHRCRDRVPAAEVSTSVGFHYDAPGAQAPQCLLLAVPGQRRSKAAAWTEAELAAIVDDTVGLAKLRAVDLDALGGGQAAPGDDSKLGQIVPALFLPADADRPSFVREVAAPSLDEWLTELLVLDTSQDFSDLELYGRLADVSRGDVRLTSADGSRLRVGGLEAGGVVGRQRLIVAAGGLVVRFAKPCPAFRIELAWLGAGAIAAFDPDGARVDVAVKTESAPTPSTLALDRTERRPIEIARVLISGPRIASLELTGPVAVQRLRMYQDG
jgi:hypothetical protein